MEKTEMIENYEFLEQYLNAYSPVGEEEEGQRVWADFMKNYTEVTADSYNNVFGRRYGTNTSGRTVVIEAHADEIAWRVSHIQDDGLIRVVRNGGSDPLIAASKKVIIHTETGKVNGVFGQIAIHCRPTGTDKVPKHQDLFIDIGFDNKADVVAQGVEVGDNVTFNETVSVMGNYVVGKALDNKIGGYVIASVAKRLKDNNIELPFDIVFVNSVSEEIGLYGATMNANNIQTGIALVIDVCHVTNAGINKAVEGEIKGGSGVVIERSAQNHRKLVKHFRKINLDNNVPYQIGIGSFGNDTMPFYEKGIPTMIQALPLKYMHTTVESAHVDDIKSAVDSFYNAIVNLDYDYIIDPTIK